MSGSVDIEKYVHGWRAPISLERLFADVLKVHPSLAQFKPLEIEPSQNSKISASDVAGALSRVIIGIGWRNVRLPTTILAFESCPIHFAVFSNADDRMGAKFFFPLPAYAKPDTWDRHGEMYIYGKGSGVLGSGSATSIEFNTKAKFSPGAEEMKNDEDLTKKLLSLLQKGLVIANWIDVKYDTISGVPFGWVDLKVENSKKKWERVLADRKMKPDDFIAEVFDNAHSIMADIGRYLEKRDPSRYKFVRM